MLHFDVSFVIALISRKKKLPNIIMRHNIHLKNSENRIENKTYRNKRCQSIFRHDSVTDFTCNYLNGILCKKNHKHTAPTTSIQFSLCASFFCFSQCGGFYDHSLRFPIDFILVTFAVQFTCFASICVSTNNTIFGQYFRIQIWI